MVKVNIFGVQDCGKCLKAKGRVSNLLRDRELAERVTLVYWDQQDFEGRAQGAWYDVDDALPVTVIEAEDQPVARWEGRAPKTEEIRGCLEKLRAPSAK